jgi:histidinol-phosphate/aromatic aminotransferase/cobyric acid decarboxylase-like protein
MQRGHFHRHLGARTDVHILGSLKKEKIIIKALGKIKGRNGGHMRVTIGTKEMNDRFLLALTKSL